jgi:hypothetical protein
MYTGKRVGGARFESLHSLPWHMGPIGIRKVLQICIIIAQWRGETVVAHFLSNSQISLEKVYSLYMFPLQVVPYWRTENANLTGVTLRVI